MAPVHLEGTPQHPQKCQVSHQSDVVAAGNGVDAVFDAPSQVTAETETSSGAEDWQGAGGLQEPPLQIRRADLELKMVQIQSFLDHSNGRSQKIVRIPQLGCP